jgi:hypothetical protein
MEVATPPATGVIGDAIARLAPAGAFPTQEGVNLTAELKPLMEFTVIVADPFPPWVKMILELDEVIEKFVTDAITTKAAEAESPTGLPLQIIGYEPTATLATINEPVNAPPEIEQV